MADQIIQEITPLPEAPKEGAGFRARAAEFLAALVTMAGQLNIFRTQVNDAATAMATLVTETASNADRALSAQTTVVELAEVVAANAQNALASKNAAATSATTATTKATSATTSATNAATSEANALASKNAAATSATAAATSATAADSRATSATLAQQDAATSRTQAATSATTATTKATEAATSATNAATSEANALASKNAAATSATAAATAKTDAETAKTGAVAAQTSAAASATTATTKATAAATSESNALAYKNATLSAMSAITVNTTYYMANKRWGVRSYSKTTLACPDNFVYNVAGTLHPIEYPGIRSLDLSSIGIWNGLGTYTTGASRAGLDFYFYGVAGDVFVSSSAVAPFGYTTENSVLLGGFHCLCANVGTISGHPLSGFVAGDIIPESVWDVRHRHPISNQGAVWDPSTNRWVMIYQPSWSGGRLVSAYGGTIADGASVWGEKIGFNYFDFCEQLALIGYRPPMQYEFMSLSNGSNQGTNIAGSVDPVTTGGHVDTAGRRMISNIGCEDCCGALWQWGLEAGGPYVTATTWNAQYDATRTSQMGYGYNVPNRALLGGSWDNGASCGSRCARWDSGPLYLSAYRGARGVAEPLAV